MPYKYVFITRWQIRAPVEEVWEAIYHSLEWPQWWEGVKAARTIQDGHENGIDGIREYTWRGILPYNIHFTSRLTEREDYSKLHGVAYGDLEGEGTWHFFEKDGVTYLQCDWRVNSNIRWMNAIAFLLKPLFRYNHRVLMNRGARGLAKKLNAELVTY
jgi:hypothetical protein